MPALSDWSGVADRRLAVAAAAAAFAPAAAASSLRHIGGAEIDRVEQQRREAEVLDGFGDDLAGEREQQARRFDQQERRQRLFGNVAEAEQAGVAQVDDEMGAVVRLGGRLRSSG